MANYPGTPNFNSYNPYATPANPYAPNPYAAMASGMAPATIPAAPAMTAPSSMQAPVAAQQTQNTNGPFIVVNGVQGAKDVQVPPNQTAWMMDQNAPQFYVKSADNLGICKMDYYRFEKFDPEREAQIAAQNQAAQQQLNAQTLYVTRDEVESIIQSKFDMFKGLLQPAPKQAIGSKSKANKENNDE